MVWTCEKTRRGICGKESVENGSAGKETERETEKTIYGRVKEDMRTADVNEDDTQDRKRWRELTRCGDP